MTAIESLETIICNLAAKSKTYIDAGNLRSAEEHITLAQKVAYLLSTVLSCAASPLMVAPLKDSST